MADEPDSVDVDADAPDVEFEVLAGVAEELELEAGVLEPVALAEVVDVALAEVVEFVEVSAEASSSAILVLFKG